MSARAVRRRLGKLPAVLQGVNSIALPLLLCHATAGCLIRPARAVRVVPAGEWLATLGDARRAPFLGEGAPEAPEEVWRAGTERGLVAAPIVHEDLLIVGSTGRVLTVASASSGREYWHRRFSGPVVGTPLRQGDAILVGTAGREGLVYAFSVERGRRLWRRALRAPLTGELVLSGGRLYASTLRGELHALDVTDGHVIWETRLPGAALGAPVLVGDALLLATARDSLVRIDLADGRVRVGVAMSGTATASAALVGEQLLVPLHPSVVARFEPRTLALLRADTLDAAVLAAPVVDANGDAYVLSSSGTVWRLSARGAERVAALGGAARESLTLARNGLLVGRLDGTLVLLRRDGTELWRLSYPASIRAPVALGGGAAFVGLLNGRIVKLQ